MKYAYLLYLSLGKEKQANNSIYLKKLTHVLCHFGANYLKKTQNFHILEELHIVECCWILCTEVLKRAIFCNQM